MSHVLVLGLCCLNLIGRILNFWLLLVDYVGRELHWNRLGFVVGRASDRALNVSIVTQILFRVVYQRSVFTEDFSTQAKQI